MSDIFEVVSQSAAHKWALVPLYINNMLSKFLYDKPLAVCIDIDGTIWLDKEKSRATKRKLFDNVKEAILFMKSKEITIFFITARSRNLIIETKNDLKDLGIFEESYQLRMLDDTKERNISKRSHRDTIREDYSIVMAIGDETHDLVQTTEAQDCDEPSLNIMIENPLTFE